MAHAALWPALALIAGVVFGLRACPAPDLLVAGAVVCLLGGVVALARGSARLVLAAVLAGFALTGAALASDRERFARDPPLAALVASVPVEQPVVVHGRLTRDAAPAPSGTTLWVRAERLQIGGQLHEATGGVVLTVAGSLAGMRRGEWRAGRRLRLTAHLRVPTRYRTPGVPNHRLDLARRGTVASGSVKSAALVEIVAPGSWIDEMAAAIRAGIRRAAAAAVGVHSPQSAALVVAILIGDRAGLDDEVEERLQRAGTYHVVAVSGGNVAVLAACVLGGLWAIGVRGRLALAAVIAVLTAYAVLVEGGASVARATLAAVIYASARLIDQRASAASVLAVAAAAILAGAPLSVLDPGLLLTFGATIGIVLIVPRVLDWWSGALPGAPGLLRPVLGMWAASLGAELLVLPIGAACFSRVTVAGLVLNFAAVPLMAGVQMAGMAAVALAAGWPGGAALVGFIAHLAADALVRSADVVERVPWASWRVAPPPLAAVATYYALLGLCLAPRAWLRFTIPVHRMAWQLAIVACAAALGLIAAGPALPTPAGDRLRLLFMDVGQGDATLIRLPDGSSWLVDAGGLPGPTRFDVGERVVAPAMWAAGVRRLDVLAITHAHPDHAGGAPMLVEAFRPREVWEGVPVPPDPLGRQLVAQAVRVRSAWREVQAGDRLRRGGVVATAWNPPAPEWERQRVRNDDSIVMEIRYGQVSIVLPGDVGAGVERTLAARIRDERDVPALRVLKTAHHGSSSSSAEEFLRALAPDVSIVSCGVRNRFGHPDPRVLARHAALGIPVLRTDEDGAIALETDGTRVHIRTWTGRTLMLPARVPDPTGVRPCTTLADCVARWLRQTRAGRRRA